MVPGLSDFFQMSHNTLAFRVSAYHLNVFEHDRADALRGLYECVIVFALHLMPASLQHTCRAPNTMHPPVIYQNSILVYHLRLNHVWY